MDVSLRYRCTSGTAAMSRLPAFDSPRYRRLSELDSIRPAPRRRHAAPPKSSRVSRSLASPFRFVLTASIAAPSSLVEESLDQRFDHSDCLIYRGPDLLAQAKVTLRRPQGCRRAPDDHDGAELRAE